LVVDLGQQEWEEFGGVLCLEYTIGLHFAARPSNRGLHGCVDLYLESYAVQRKEFFRGNYSNPHVIAHLKEGLIARYDVFRIERDCTFYQ